MIAICTPIYPWYGPHDRLGDLWDALLPSIEKMDNKSQVQFSLVDNGTRDIHGMNRKHDADKFERNIREFCNDIGVKFTYSLKDNFAPHPKTGQDVWHLSKTLDDAINQSRGKDLFIAGADLILPKDFVKRCNDNIKKGKEVWVPHCFNLMRGQSWKEQYTHPLNGWRVARGILGITRVDYKAVGGYPVKRIGFRVGIDAALLKKCINNFKLNEFKCPGLFHLDHEGSKARLPGKIEKR